MTDRINEPHMSVRASMMRRLNECAKRWAGQRSAEANIATIENFIEQCLELGIADSLSIEQRHIDCFKLGLETRGLSPSTINTRMVTIKAYIDHLVSYCTACVYLPHATRLAALKISYKTRKKQAKWHMTDEQLRRTRAIILPALVASGNVSAWEADLFDDYLQWTMETGLRVEETLRLLPSDGDNMYSERPALMVPGTKNEHSAVRIPVSLAAAEVWQHRIAVRWRTGLSARLFDISYARLRAMWEMVREALGLKDNPTATLKALRRNFALNALRKGLDARIIQELMRHSSLETTMGYLRLFGMSDNDETRALLNRQLGLKHRHPDGSLHSEPYEPPRSADRDTNALIKQLEALGFKVVTLE